jgi:hypothetical protein
VWQLDQLDETEVHLLEVKMDHDVDEDKWWEHEPLTWLDLSSNCISKLPPQIKNLVTLTVLNVSKSFCFVFKISLLVIMCVICCLKLY